MLLPILLAAVAESVASFSGGFLVLFRDSFARMVAHRILGFAIGALIGVSFFEIIPEAAEILGFERAFQFVIAGIILFFIVEKFLRWYHYHQSGGDGAQPFATLLLVGDAIHNFIDGVIIAVSFLASVPLGVATTIAVVVHEIPQEVADFGVLIRGGYSRRKALWYNFLISLTTILGALLGYVFGFAATTFLPYLLAFIAGNFLYIAMSDLIPETHEEAGAIHFVIQVVLMAGGAALMYFLGIYISE